MKNQSSKLLKLIPKTRMKLTWDNLKRVVLEVAAARGERIIDLFTDEVSRRTIMRLFIRSLKTQYAHVKVFPSAAKPLTNALGMRYDSFLIPIRDSVTNMVLYNVTLNVVTDDWFDTYLKERRKRGWKSVLALMLDMREFDGLEPRKNFQPTHHRAIYFK